MAYTTQTFIAKAQQAHGDAYDYSKVNLSHSKITIICPIHGDFTQSMYSHIRGVGCNLCAKTKRAATNLAKYGGHPMTCDSVQEKVKQTNLARYGAEHVLQSSHIKEKQEQTMLSRHGVRNASLSCELSEKRRLTTVSRYGVNCVFSNPVIQQKILDSCTVKYGGHPTQSHAVQVKHRATCLERYGVENASQSHMGNMLELIQSYDWLYNEYVTERKPAVQIAQELGINDVTIGRYLKKAEIEIRKYCHSYVSIIWLEAIMESENIHIQHALNGGEYVIPGTRWKADGYCEITNTIYEFHGDYWHGNPLVYAPDVINGVIHKSMGELYRRTLEREEAIKAMGYNLVVKWENDF